MLSLFHFFSFKRAYPCCLMHLIGTNRSAGSGLKVGRPARALVDLGTCLACLPALSVRGATAISRGRRLHSTLSKLELQPICNGTRKSCALNRSGYSLGQLVLKPSELRPMYTAEHFRAVASAWSQGELRKKPVGRLWDCSAELHRGTTCKLMSGWRRSKAVHGDNHIETLVGSEVAQGIR